LGVRSTEMRMNNNKLLTSKDGTLISNARVQVERDKEESVNNIGSLAYKYPPKLPWTSSPFTVSHSAAKEKVIHF